MIRPPSWVTVNAVTTLKTGHTYTAEWLDGDCILRGGTGSSRLGAGILGPTRLGGGVGWLVLSAGQCGVTRGGQQVFVSAQAALTPDGLPLSTRPWLAWKEERDSVVLEPTSPCDLQFWSVDTKALTERKNGGHGPKDLEQIRALLVAGGRDPYLSFLQHRTVAAGSFDDVPHPLPNAKPLAIELNYVSIGSRKGNDPWHPLFDFEEPPRQLSVLLDGWARHWVDVGVGGHEHGRLINLMRSPVLLGDAYRPKRETENASPAPLRSRVDVRPLDRSYSGVHVLSVSFKTLGEWYKLPNANVANGLRCYTEQSLWNLQASLSIGLNYRWRLIRWLLDEDQQLNRERSQERRRSIWIPGTVLGYKLVVGASQSNGSAGIHDDAARAWKEGNHNLEHLRSDGHIDLVSADDADDRTSKSDGSNLSVRIRVLDRPSLEAALPQAACDRYPCPGRPVCNTKKGLKRERKRARNMHRRRDPASEDVSDAV